MGDVQTLSFRSHQDLNSLEQIGADVMCMLRPNATKEISFADEPFGLKYQQRSMQIQ